MLNVFFISILINKIKIKTTYIIEFNLLINRLSLLFINTMLNFEPALFVTRFFDLFFNTNY